MSLLLLHGRDTSLVRSGLTAFYDFEKRNLLQYSERFDNAVWGAGIVAADQEISPRGDQTADAISDESAGAAAAFVQSAAVVSSTASYTFSVFVRKDDDEARMPEFRIQPKGGTGEPLTAGQLNTKTGDFQIRTGSGSMSVGDEGNYWRVSVTETDSGSGNTQVDCSIVPAYTDSLGGSANAALNGTVVVWGAQLNQGAVAFGYEKTENNQALADRSGLGNDGQLGSTAGADTNDPLWRDRRLDFGGLDDYALTPSAITSNATALTMQIVFQKQTGSAAAAHRALFGHNLGGSYIRFFTDTTIGFWLEASTSGQLVQGPAGGVPDDGQWKMMTFRWKSGVVQDQVLNEKNRLAFQEANPAAGTHTKTFRTIGMYDNARFFHGQVASALFYRRFLRLTEVAQNYRWLRGTLSSRGIVLP